MSFRPMHVARSSSAQLKKSGNQCICVDAANVSQIVNDGGLVYKCIYVNSMLTAIIDHA